MPQIEVTTGLRNGEPEPCAIKRLNSIAGKMKSKLVNRTDAIRMFDNTPAIQRVGDKVILRWHYKQYPRLKSTG